MSPRATILRAAVLLVAYVVIAHGVGNLFPFSGFEMYGATRLGSSSRIAVRTAAGLREVEAFSAWRCELPPDPDPRQCAAQWPFFHVEARDREALAHVAHAPAPTHGEAVVLIRRVWRLEQGAYEVDDCELARCEVAP
ncbi:MAG: hypothetical protein K1X88_25620 [Nannocystaceae bacterium]|nr:hypothetical protein [Nannocystaceae bacterium]